MISNFQELYVCGQFTPGGKDSGYNLSVLYSSFDARNSAKIHLTPSTDLVLSSDGAKGSCGNELGHRLQARTPAPHKLLWHALLFTVGANHAIDGIRSASRRLVVVTYLEFPQQTDRQQIQASQQ